MTNLYKTSSGTPVTADGQPVGLVLDKSQDGTLGSELALPKINDVTGWTPYASNTVEQDGDAVKINYVDNSGGAFTYLRNFAGGSLTTDLSTNTAYRINGEIKVTSGESAIYVQVNAFQSNMALTTSTTFVPFSFTVMTDDALSAGQQYLRFSGLGIGESVLVRNISVKEVLGTHASQPVATQRPTYNANPDRLTLDLVDDGLLVDIPTGGWDGYMTVGTDLGTATYGVSLPEGNYELGGDYFFGNTINNVLFREGEMQPAHRQAIEQIFVDEGAKASYGDVTSFTSYWRDKGITEFPLLDTSSGTNFYGSWRDNSLTSFPELDMRNATNLQFAWWNNSLTEFPAIDFPVCTSFANAWQDNNLTSFPLIDTSSGINFQSAWYNNNLTSFPLIDTSSGTNFGYTWRDNNLTSFPQLDMSSATNVEQAWRGNDLTDFPAIDMPNCTKFGAAWQHNSLTSFPLIDVSSGTSFISAWYGNSLTSFPLLDTSNGTNFYFAWRDNNLTSFPLLDVSSGTNFGFAWQNNDLTSFPLLDVSNGTDFAYAWSNNNLTSFPLIDTSSGINLRDAWSYNSSMTSFPALDFSSATNMIGAWYYNRSLSDFPASVFDNCACTAFNGAFKYTNLSEQSIDNILVSINSNGTSNGTFDQSGGSAPSATGESAITALRSRGWTITVTGGF